jgi:hypothetical protein
MRSLLAGAIADSGPSVRELKRELLDFFETVYGLSPEAKDLLNDEWPEWPGMPSAETATALKERFAELEDRKITTTPTFFADLCWLLGHANVELKLPSKGYSNYVRPYNQFPLFRVARVLIKVAIELAGAHAPKALTTLRKLQKRRTSGLVEEIRKGRKQRSLFSVHLLPLNLD